MRNFSVFVLFVAFCFADGALAENDLRFVAVDVYLQTSEPVAAWQFELSDKYGQMRVVGVENGESLAYRRAPYYDREAVRLGQADRVIVADYSLADINELPSGYTRIATIHLMQDDADDEDMESTLITATAHDGRVIDASIRLVLRTGSEQ